MLQLELLSFITPPSAFAAHPIRSSEFRATFKVTNVKLPGCYAIKVVLEEDNSEYLAAFTLGFATSFDRVIASNFTTGEIPTYCLKSDRIHTFTVTGLYPPEGKKGPIKDKKATNNAIELEPVKGFWPESEIGDYEVRLKVEFYLAKLGPCQDKSCKSVYSIKEPEPRYTFESKTNDVTKHTGKNPLHDAMGTGIKLGVGAGTSKATDLIIGKATGKTKMETKRTLALLVDETMRLRKDVKRLNQRIQDLDS